MSVCLDYQAVQLRRGTLPSPVRVNFVVGLLLVIALCTKVHVKLTTTDLGYDLARERQRTVALDMERRELELQRSVLLRSDTLARRAEQVLGLRALNGSQARRIIIVE